MLLELPTKHPREGAKPIIARLFIYWNLAWTHRRTFLWAPPSGRIPRDLTRARSKRLGVKCTMPSRKSNIKSQCISCQVQRTEYIPLHHTCKDHKAEHDQGSRKNEEKTKRKEQCYLMPKTLPVDTKNSLLKRSKGKTTGNDYRQNQ